MLEETGLDPDALLLEIRENAVTEDADLSEAMLRGLNGLGALVAIDDFGTGYSSPVHLKRFPLEMLKIDRFFVNEIGRNPEAIAIIGAVCTLGQNLEMQVLTEGIETSGQLEQLPARVRARPRLLLLPAHAAQGSGRDDLPTPQHHRHSPAPPLD